MAELATAYVQVIPSTKGMKSALSGDMNAAGASAGKSAGSSMAGAIKGALIAAGIGKIVSSALNEGGKLQQSLGGIETLFKDSASAVVANAENAYKTAGLSANAYMETATSFAASLLQGLGGDTQRAAEMTDTAITDMADNANKMGTAMESIQNAYQGFAKQNYTMLDNLKLGYGGTKQEMERLLKDAEAISGVHYDISNLADVYSAIHEIQGQLGITGTTAKEAEATFTGSMAAMKAALQNFLGALTTGGDVKKTLGELLDSVNTFLSKNLLPMLTSLVKSIPEVVSGLLVDGFDSKFGEFTDNIVEFAISTVEALIDSIPDSLTVLLGAVGKLLDSLNSKMPSLLEKVFDGVKRILKEAIEQLPQNLSNIIKTVTSILVTIIKAITEFIKGDNGEFIAVVQDTLFAVLDALLECLPQIIECVTTLVVAVIEKLPEIIERVAEMMPDLIEKIGDIIVQCAPIIIEAVVRLVQELCVRLPDIIASIFDVIRGSFEGIGNVLQPYIEQISSLFDGLVSDISNKLAPIKDGFNNMFGELIVSVVNLCDSIKEFFSALGEFIGAVFDYLDAKFGPQFAAARSAIETAFAPIKDFFQSVVDKAKDEFKALVDFFSRIGTEMMDALKESIRNAAQGVLGTIHGIVDEISGIFDGITNKVKDATTFIKNKAEEARNASDSIPVPGGNGNSSGYQSVGMSAANQLNGYSVNSSGSDYSLASAVSRLSGNAATPVNVTVELSGSARNIFDTVRVENNKLTTATGYHALA